LSNKGWLVFIILTVIIIYGSIFLIRTKVHLYDKDETCYDLNADGVPVFVNSHFVDLDKIEYIKRFRSGFGTNNPDDFESCRCMTNSFIPFQEYWDLDNEIEIYSPINGVITQIIPVYVNDSGKWVLPAENSATRVYIRSEEHPDFIVEIRLVDIRITDIKSGMKVSEGQLIGYANLDSVETVLQTPFISIHLNTNICPDANLKKLSYFDVITDDLFEGFIDRGAKSRDQFIISKEDRDNDPLVCVWSSDEMIAFSFIWEKGNIKNWVYLGTSPDDFEIVYDFE